MKEVLLFHTISLVLGVIADLLIGDPHSMPHPVRAMGSLILFLEKTLLGAKKKEDRDPEREKRRGALLWLIVVATATAVTALIVVASYRVNRYLGVLAQTVLTCYILAAGSLYRESMAVFRELQKGDLDAARSALSMIVGRDTACLSEEEVIKATVETVAENTSDGVIAPFLYTAVGGPVPGMAYKAVNTMDSMLGYHNDRYEYFGRTAAVMDDVFNFLPSRLSALLMIAGSAVLGLFSEAYDARGAFRIWVRDRHNHTSPNSAQTESVCAGALGLKLGGTHLYRGVPVEKPTIGDETRKPDISDIPRANRLMFMTEAAAAAVAVPVLIGIVSRI